ncbi:MULTISPECIES: hypothetical protein [Nostocales]|jgi:hypothetical protein|uniref:Uncharacterized protein n=1 Tax=Dolichospermum flos-aquae UHCC 0037 TaxID=2590026 RepID=A0ACC7S963_DOLFA|nr:MULTISPECIES: hypothetical protein [Nostocales]MBO1065152.1 hypothetical protein [Anabaena sp. 54]MTJ44866.1 hypothetical protein [Dolichospermum flos-aquae UHCC 0037]
MQAQEARKEAIKKLYSSYLSVDGALEIRIPDGEDFTVHQDNDEKYVSKVQDVKSTLEEALEDLYVAYRMEVISREEISTKQDLMQKIKEIAES